MSVCVGMQIVPPTVMAHALNLVWLYTEDMDDLYTSLNGPNHWLGGYDLYLANTREHYTPVEPTSTTITCYSVP